MEYYIRDLTLEDQNAFNEALNAKLFLNEFIKSKHLNGIVERTNTTIYYIDCTYNQILKDENEFEQIKLYLRKLTCNVKSFSFESGILKKPEFVCKYEGISNELYKKHLEIKGFTAQEFYNLSKVLFSINSAISVLREQKIKKDSILVFNNDLRLSDNRTTKAYQLRDFFDEIRANYITLMKLSKELNCILVEHFLDFLEYSSLLDDADNLKERPSTLTKSYKKLFENDFILLNNADSINQIIDTHLWDSNEIFQNWFIDGGKVLENFTYIYSRTENGRPFYRNNITFSNDNEFQKQLNMIYLIISGLMIETHYGAY